VRLTPKADKFLREFLPGHFRTTAKLMGVLTEAERKTLVRLLTKISAQAAAMVSPAAASAPTEPAAHAV
jgi:DNA-binding MarR family transcriptional regulator